MRRAQTAVRRAPPSRPAAQRASRRLACPWLSPSNDDMKSRGAALLGGQIASSGQNGHVISRVRVAAQIVAVVLLLVAALAGPWLSYHVGSGRARSLDAGGFAGLLVAVAALAAAFSLGELSTRFRWWPFAIAAVGVVAIVLSAVTAATRMAHANDLTASVNAPATTSWAWGTLIAVIAAIAITALPLFGRMTSTSSTRAG